MKTCPVCLNRVESATRCPHCSADIRQLEQTQLLEKLATPRRAINTYQEILRVYQQSAPPQATGRILDQLALACLKAGQWREARLYWEQVIALGDEAGNAAFGNRVRRQLGALLGRSGEIPLANHLLMQAEQAGDPLAAIERLRLEVQARHKKTVLEQLAELDKQTLSMMGRAWVWDARIRYTNLDDISALRQDLALAEESQLDAVAAVLLRAKGIWHSQQAEHSAAFEALERASHIFAQTRDLFELARTQLELATAYLLSINHLTDAPTPDIQTDTDLLKSVQRLLAHAVTIFRQLGVPTLYGQAMELAQSLVLGETPQPLRSDVTHSSVNLIWVALSSGWDEPIWSQVIDTAHRQGGLVKRMLGGVAVLISQEGKVAIETALAIHDLLTFFAPQQTEKVTFRMVCALGMFAHDPADMLHTLRILPRASLFLHTRSQAQDAPDNAILVNDLLYLGMQSTYAFTQHIRPDDTPKPPSPSRDILTNPRWWLLDVPQQHPPERPAPNLSLQTVQRLFDAGAGLLVIEGEAGSGKTTLIEQTLKARHSLPNHWLMHLRGRESQSNQPFGTLRNWLGYEEQPSNGFPNAPRLTQVSKFYKSVLGLLQNRPLLLIVDDIDRMDSSTLTALQALLPLLATHRLMMMITARPSAGDWRKLVQTARHAIPRRSFEQRLAPRPLEVPALPEDLTTRHVLACAVVLGDQCLALVLRRMSEVRDLVHHLKLLAFTGFLTPLQNNQTWRFVDTAVRDHLYETMQPDYRALLHWYARQALKSLGLPADHHIDPAGLPDPALKINLRYAQAALMMDAMPEALHFFDRALHFYQSGEPPVDVLISKIAILLSLEDLPQAQQLIEEVRAIRNLAIEDRVALLIQQGELLLRVGEIAQLFRLFEEAAALIRHVPDPEAHISLIYAQALARYKRQEIEIAGSLLGGALSQAAAHQLEDELPHLWELLADVQRIRGNYGVARKVNQRALVAYAASGSDWAVLPAQQRDGELSLLLGDLDQAERALRQALDIAVSIGSYDAALMIRERLATIALYRGDFDVYVGQMRAKLQLIPFAGDDLSTAHADLAEALLLHQKPIDALYHAITAVQMDANSVRANLARALAVLALNRPAEAADSVDTAQRLLTAESAESLRLRVWWVQMQIAVARQQMDVLDHYWEQARRLRPAADDTFWRAQIAWLTGQTHAELRNWNIAARELERAAQLFSSLGARHWHKQARILWRQVAPHASRKKRETHVRGVY